MFAVPFEILAVRADEYRDLLQSVFGIEWRENVESRFGSTEHQEDVVFTLRTRA
jgi:hypothetical protein